MTNYHGTFPRGLNCRKFASLLFWWVINTLFVKINIYVFDVKLLFLLQKIKKTYLSKPVNRNCRLCCKMVLCFTLNLKTGKLLHQRNCCSDICFKLRCSPFLKELLECNMYFTHYYIFKSIKYKIKVLHFYIIYF